MLTIKKLKQAGETWYLVLHGEKVHSIWQDYEVAYEKMAKFNKHLLEMAHVIKYGKDN